MKNKEFRKAIAERQYRVVKQKLDEGIGEWIDTAQDWADWASIGLSAVPGFNLIGSGIDYVSSGIDAMQGQYKDAAWRAASGTVGILPFGRLATGAGKIVKAVRGLGKFGKAGVEAAETAAKAATKAEKPIEVVVKRIPGTARGAEGAIETAAKSVESGAESASKSLPSAAPKQIPSRPRTGLDSAYRGDPQLRLSEPTHWSSDGLEKAAQARWEREVADIPTSRTAVRDTSQFKSAEDMVNGIGHSSPTMNPIVRSGTQSGTATATKDLTDVYAQALAKAEARTATQAATKTATQAATQAATKTATQAATKTATPLKTATKTALKVKKSTNKETFFEPKDGSEGKGEEINRYGISHTSFGSAPTAVLIASGDASRPNTTFARSSILDDGFNLSELLKNKTITKLNEMSKPRPGKIDPEAEKFIIIERPKSNLNPELEKFIIRRPTKPASSGKPPINPKYADMPINKASMEIPATKKILQKPS